VLTPQGSWHDHTNTGDEPVIWMDLLDVPLVRFLGALKFENYAQDQQAIAGSGGLALQLAGPLRRPDAHAPRTGAAYNYKGAAALQLLRELPERESDPYDGVTLEYRDPYDGGPTLPTVQCRLHRLQPGQRLRRHRHTWNAIYHVVSGHGETIAGERSLSWGPHDTFAIPSLHWHEHRALDEEVVLFSATDEPVFRAFALDQMDDGAA